MTRFAELESLTTELELGIQVVEGRLKTAEDLAIDALYELAKSNPQSKLWLDLVAPRLVPDQESQEFDLARG